ncbi:hypothetical protein V5P93_005801 [Actinokineospora auranticolor]|uniref:Parallel beta helix pectate lyase-like protein n=1 Tax=Actinokineospora auranticolor TaxID=155976 RepID=A0A2S6GJT7_9PSEU|nr:hypothetical protein [Actinokineospora auranticolor]PPK65421.1 hypothetical protein CLV40_11473 [Actinokineospora auranticolor]
MAKRGWLVGVVVVAVAGVVFFQAEDDDKPQAKADSEAAQVVGAPQPRAANRREPIPGLYDWSHAGYRGGAPLPTDAQLTPDDACRVTPDELAALGARPDDSQDDTAGLQQAIDTLRDRCSPSADHDHLSLIDLPRGTLLVTRQLAVDADYLLIRGTGPDTRVTFRPDRDTLYDSLTPDGGDWDEDGMSYKQGKGGWLWPGRGLFRVQSRAVHPAYRKDYESAPANRKDLFEGTVNVHWKAGVPLAAKPGDQGFSARTGDTVIHLAKKNTFTTGTLVNIRAANTAKFYEQQNAPVDKAVNQHMRQQVFRVTVAADKTITLDKPLEFDVPVDSTSDGSPAIDGDAYQSKASPIVDPVVGVGFESFSLTQETGLDPDAARANYGNLAPAAEMHGIVFKWAADSWVRGVHATMTGSHPIVTEEAKNLTIADNEFTGSWNKGKGGNGYLRGSRVWDSLYENNTATGLRHFTFQWSASGNVVTGNSFAFDINLHGGWERHNLFERNTVRVPYSHRSANCASNCGEEGGGGPDDSTWYPIWWGAGEKAVKWSCATGPRNVFFDNAMAKQLTENGPYEPFYADRHRVYQFGWSGTEYRHLRVDSAPITDWAHNESRDYTQNNGVFADLTEAGESLFYK